MTGLLKEDDERFREVVRSIFAFYQQAGPSVRLGRTLLEKSLWEFKVRLPKGHELEESFGFYWWLRGYFSDQLLRCIDVMLSAGEIEQDDDDLLYMPREILEQSFSDDVELSERIGAYLPVLASFEARRPVEEVIMQHYNLYAPNQFCLTYPRFFLPAFSRFLEAVQSGHPPILGPADFRMISLARLDDAATSLPFEPYYDPFRVSFLSFRIILQRVLRHYEAFITRDPGLWTRLTGLAEDYWKLHCMFLRERYHDTSLSNREGKWRDEKKALLDELESSTNELYDAVLLTIGEEKLGERLVDRPSLVSIVEQGLNKDDIVSVDTDRFALDWEDLRQRSWKEVAEALETAPFRKVKVRYRHGRDPEELALKIKG